VSVLPKFNSVRRSHLFLYIKEHTVSKIDLGVRNQDVIPEILAPELFADNPDAQFAVGIIALGSEVLPGATEVYRGYGLLRARVYADQTHMIDPSQVKADGTETDEDDARSVHFAIVENATDAELQRVQRVVGSLRLILKDDKNPQALPVEEFFAEQFTRNPAPVPSTEASRFICRHEDIRTQNWLKWPLFQGAVAYIMAHGIGETYGVVEPPVEASLQKSGLKITRVADPVYIEEYAAKNLAFEVDTRDLARTLNLSPSDLESMRKAEGRFTFPVLPEQGAKPKQVVA